jgi:AcrR family transcriptional regulator
LCIFVNMATETERPLRRDAERNRQRIMESAGVLFAERGLSVSMDDIARHAGVGVGTVYRRFPDKELLIEALFEEHMDHVVGFARDALAMESAWAGLCSFMDRALCQQAANRGLKELMISSGHGQAHVARGREELAPLLEEMVARAQESGELRPDVSVTDFALLQMSLGSIIDYTRDADPDIWRRCLGLMLDGMRTQRERPTALPGPALDMEQVECAMRDWRPARR